MDNSTYCETLFSTKSSRQRCVEDYNFIGTRLRVVWRTNVQSLGDYYPHGPLTLVVCMIFLHKALAYELCGWLFFTIFRILRHEALSHYICGELFSTVHSHTTALWGFFATVWRINTHKALSQQLRGGLFSTGLSHISSVDDFYPQDSTSIFACRIIIFKALSH